MENGRQVKEGASWLLQSFIAQALLALVIPYCRLVLAGFADSLLSQNSTARG